MIPYESDPLSEEAVARAVRLANHMASDDETRARYQELQSRIADGLAADPVRVRNYSPPKGGSLGKHSLPKFAHVHNYTRRWIAAVCVGMLVFAALWTRHPSADRGVTRTIATSTREQRQFKLHDGTQVLLGPNSTLRLANFGSSSRTVIVDGEAFFDVPHTSGAAFIVRSGDATVRVLGTAFLVNSRHDGRHSHVAVFNGRVSMGVSKAGTHHPAVILGQGQVGDVGDSTVRVSETNDLMSGIELRHGNFIFHDTPLLHVLQTLTRWYGYEFRCNDSTLVHQLVSVPLSQRSSAAAISTLQELLDVTSTVVGDTITLVAQPSVRKQAPARTRPYSVFVPTREVGR